MALVGEIRRSFLKDSGIEDGPCMMDSVLIGEDKACDQTEGVV